MTKTLSPLTVASAALLGLGTIGLSAPLFAAADLAQGYEVADASKAGEAKCGEGKCGEAKSADAKGGEGKCGEGKDADAKGAEAKCGEGKCGG